MVPISGPVPIAYKASLNSFWKLYSRGSLGFCARLAPFPLHPRGFRSYLHKANLQSSKLFGTFYKASAAGPPTLVRCVPLLEGTSSSICEKQQIAGFASDRRTRVLLPSLDNTLGFISGKAYFARTCLKNLFVVYLGVSIRRCCLRINIITRRNEIDVDGTTQRVHCVKGSLWLFTCFLSNESHNNLSTSDCILLADPSKSSCPPIIWTLTNVAYEPSSSLLRRN